MIVRELISRLGFAVDKQSISKVDGAIKSVDTKAQNLAANLRGMFAGLVGLHTIKTLISTGDAMQSLEARIKLLPQTIGAAGEAFDIVADRAVAARTSIEAYGTLYVRLGQALRAFNYTQEDTLAVTDAISAALVVSGAAASEAASVTLQLSQAFNKGKLDGDEFRAFMEGLSADFKDKLAAELGTTADKFFEMSRSGELTARKLADAFRRMAPEIQKQLLKMPMTVGQAITIVGAKFGKLVAKMNRESLAISKIAESITLAFDSVEKKIKELEKRFDGFGNILRFVGEVAALSIGIKAVAAIKSLTAASWMAMGRFALFAGAILLVALAIDDLIVWFRGGNSALGDLLGNTDEARQAFVGFFAVIAGGASVFYAWQAGMRLAQAAVVAWNGVVVAAQAVQWAWNFAMSANPLGAIVAAVMVALPVLAALGALLFGQWDKIKNFFAGFLSGVGKKVIDWVKAVGRFFGRGAMNANINQNVSGVGPGSMAQGTGKGGNVLNKNTTVNMTVPPGTPAEQQKFLQGAAQKAFAGGGSLGTAEMGVYAP